VRADDVDEVAAGLVAVVAVVFAGELAVVAGDFAVAGEVEVVAVAGDFVVAGEVDVFGELCAKPTLAGRAARRAIARIERIGFMEWSFLVWVRSSSGMRDP
jgi:hypothetical protein